MKSIVDMAMSRHLMHGALYGDAADRDRQQASQVELESWARRAMWTLVGATSLWDIAATFDRHFNLTARLF